LIIISEYNIGDIAWVVLKTSVKGGAGIYEVYPVIIVTVCADVDSRSTDISYLVRKGETGSCQFNYPESFIYATKEDAERRKLEREQDERNHNNAPSTEVSPGT
jgi:hypothetical protein